MKFVFLISCFLLLASSAFATSKNDLQKEVNLLRRIMAVQVKKSEAMERKISDEIFKSLNRLQKQSEQSVELVANTNETALSIWKTRASFANVSIIVCTSELADLWVTKRDVIDEMKKMIIDEASLQFRINREVSEAINATILDEVILLEDKINNCDDNDDICLEFIDIRIKSDWEKLPAVIDRGLKTQAAWFTDNTILPNIRAVVRKFKSHTTVVVNTIVTCIKERLDEDGDKQ